MTTLRLANFDWMMLIEMRRQAIESWEIGFQYVDRSAYILRWYEWKRKEHKLCR